MNRFDAIIFDLDGTLLDTLADLCNACNAALVRHGFRPLDSDTYKMLVGYGVHQLIQDAVAQTDPQTAPDQVDAVERTYRRLYADGWHRETRLYAGVTDLLASLRQAGIAAAVLSNKPQDRTQDVIDFYFPAQTFAPVFGQLDPWPPKPDPSLALEICRRLNVRPERTALLGDSGSDMQTAVRSGLTGLGAAWGFRSVEELTANGAAAVFAAPADLQAWLLSAHP